MKFNPKLESLRGIAAFIVAISHAIIVLKPVNHEQVVVDKILHFLFNGQCMVMFFFTLSGCVLGYSLRDLQQKNGLGKEFAAFCIRRIGRIYPAAIFAWFFILLYLCTFHHSGIINEATEWYNGFYQKMPQWNQFIPTLLFRDTSLNNVTWSLRSEMINSLFLPFLYLIFCRLSLFYNAVVLVVLMGVSHVFSNHFLLFMPYFYAGLILSSDLIVIFEKKTVLRLLTIVLSIVLLLVGGFYWSRPVMLAGSFILILAAQQIWSEKVMSILLSTPIRLMGKISYSFYLLHFIFLYITAYVFFHSPLLQEYGKMGIWVNPILFLISLPFSISISWISWRYIETPTIVFSKKISLFFLNNTELSK